jgi:hypothetical protein
MGILAALNVAKKVVKVAGTVSGVLGTKADGTSIAARKTRLAASTAALLVALLSWFGVPPEVAQAVADFFVVLSQP